MHILFLARTLGYGGAAKILTFLANKLVETEQISILFYEQKEINRPLNDSINAVYIPLSGSGMKTRLKRFFQLNKSIKHIKPDIIISFLSAPNFYATLIGIINRIPVVISERGDPSLDMTSKAQLQRRFYNLASGAVFQTDGAKECYPTKLQRKSAVIPNPVPNDSTIIHDASVSNHIISFVARFENRQKRQDLMLQALFIIVKNYPDAILKFYGDGEDEAMIREMTNQLGLQKNVQFMGYTSKVKEVIDESEVFCLTSDYEGIPNTLIEAMSIGMPVVSTDCTPGGARLLIQNEENGLLVDRQNPNQIAKAICKVFEDEGLRIKIGKEAKRIRERFSESNIVEEWRRYIATIK